MTLLSIAQAVSMAMALGTISGYLLNNAGFAAVGILVGISVILGALLGGIGPLGVALSVAWILPCYNVGLAAGLLSRYRSRRLVGQER